jgi:hypothetical protein
MEGMRALRHSRSMVSLALAQGQGPEVDAILVQQVVDHEDQLPLVGPARPHFGVELAKVRLAAGINETELAIEGGRVRRQVLKGVYHAPQAIGVFGTALGIEPHLVAGLDDLKTVAIPLGLMEPALARGRAGGIGGDEGSDEGWTHNS